MKTITVKVPITKYELVTKGFKEKTIYETEDGKQFDKEKDAIAYENLLEYNRKFRQIKTIESNTELSDFFSDYPFYFASNEEELLMIINHFGGIKQRYNHVNIFGELEIGEWITVKTFDGGDSRGETNFYTLTFIKQEIDKFLKSFEGK